MHGWTKAALLLAIAGMVTLACWPGADRSVVAQVPPQLPVTLDRMNVTIDVRDQTAATHIDFVFKNSTNQPQEAILLFPVPPNAAITDFTLSMGGQTVEGQLLDSAAAAQSYADIVRRSRDPALLEYAGQGALRARVYPVPPLGESVLSLRATQLVTIENGALRYRLPLGAGESASTLLQLTIQARITATQGVRSLFSPTHDMRFARENDATMTGSYEGRGVPARGDFELNALLAGDAISAGLITYRLPPEDGYVMLWLAPPLNQTTVVAKDVMLVLDISGSMAGLKITQAKAALSFVLNSLNPDDRFNIISFSDTVTAFATSFQPASAAADGLTFVDGLAAIGGTDINTALLTALNGTDQNRLTTLIFLTDGLPTVGEQHIDRILANVTAAAPPSVRLFAFGVGDDVNTVLLDGLAVQNHGDVQYVRPNEDVEAAVSTLYSRISAPQLTDLQLDFGDSVMYDVYPRPLPDLFGGQTLFVTGRYRAQDAGPVAVQLAGNAPDGQRTFLFAGLNLANNDQQASYLPRLWASRKVGSLLRDIQINGPTNNSEQIAEVQALGSRYGIVTPYNSFFVPPPAGQPPAGRPTTTARPTPAATSGAGAVAAAATAGALAAATPAPPAPPPPTVAPTRAPTSGGTTPPSAAAPEVRTVGDRSFALRNGVWVDTTYQAGTDTVKIPFASDAYFALLVDHPEVAPYLALGERVIVVFGDIVYEITAGS